MTLLVYVAFGALCNSLIQDLTFIDGLYFTTVTIETIGFGDITPNTTGARLFVCCYMVFGIINIGLVVGMCRETVLEALEVGYRRRIQKMRLRRREARRFRKWETRWRRAVEWRLKERGLPVWVHDRHMQHEGIHFVGLSGPGAGVSEAHWFRKFLETRGLKKPKEEDHPHIKGQPRGKHLNIDALSNQQLEAAALEAGVPLEMFTASRHGRSTMDVSRGHPIRRPSDRNSTSLPYGSSIYRTSSANGWPAHPQTPTHAQVGRMAAMITKFAIATTGTRVRMLGHASEDVELREKQPQEPIEDTSNPGRKRGNSVWFGEHAPNQAGAEHDWNNDGGRACESPIEFRVENADETGDQPQNGPSATPIVESQVQPPKWARELARGIDQRSSVSYENYKQDMESEERKAYLAKVCILIILIHLGKFHNRTFTAHSRLVVVFDFLDGKLVNTPRKSS